MFKQILVNLFAKLGYVVLKLPTIENQIKARKFEWLRKLGIRTVLDVGSNDGKFAGEINKILPEAFIYSFEPLPDVFEQLKLNTSRIKNIQYNNYALGEKEEEKIIFKNDYTPSSSLLKMKTLHKKAFPFTVNSREETVRVKTLDTISDNLKLDSRLLLKLDVQGYEINVLKGSLRLLEKVDVIIAETSFYELYENQPLFKDVFDFLRQYNFKYVGNMVQLEDSNDGKILQADSVFIKSSILK